MTAYMTLPDELRGASSFTALQTFQAGLLISGGTADVGKIVLPSAGVMNFNNGDIVTSSSGTTLARQVTVSASAAGALQQYIKSTDSATVSGIAFSGSGGTGDIGHIFFSSGSFNIRPAVGSSSIFAVQSDGQMQVGVSAAIADFDVSAITLKQPVTINDATAPTFTFNLTDTSVTSGQTIGLMNFYTNDASADGTGVSAAIKVSAYQDFGGGHRYSTLELQNFSAGGVLTSFLANPVNTQLYCQGILGVSVGTTGAVTIGPTVNEPYKTYHTTNKSIFGPTPASAAVGYGQWIIGANSYMGAASYSPTRLQGLTGSCIVFGTQTSDTSGTYALAMNETTDSATTTATTVHSITAQGAHTIGPSSSATYSTGAAFKVATGTQNNRVALVGTDANGTLPILAASGTFSFRVASSSNNAGLFFIYYTNIGASALVHVGFNSGVSIVSQLGTTFVTSAPSSSQIQISFSNTNSTVTLTTGSGISTGNPLIYAMSASV